MYKPIFLSICHILPYVQEQYELSEENNNHFVVFYIVFFGSEENVMANFD